MTNQSKGRVGVAPSREHCPVCDHLAQLVPNLDGERVCPSCCAIYAALVADAAAAHKLEAMPDGLHDALYRYAALRSTSN